MNNKGYRLQEEEESLLPIWLQYSPTYVSPQIGQVINIAAIKTQLKKKYIYKLQISQWKAGKTKWNYAVWNIIFETQNPG